MRHAVFPADHKSAREEHRLELLRSTHLLNAQPEHDLDLLVDLAREISGCRFAAVSLIDADTQWLKAERGLGVHQTPRDASFCTVAVELDETLVVEDATLHPRFANYSAVTGEPGIRFYAGVPLRAQAHDGSARMPLGTLCVSDDAPRVPSADELDRLQRLATLAEALIESRISAHRATEISAHYRANHVALDRAHRQLQQTERMAEIGSWRLDLVNQALTWSDGVFAIHGLPTGAPPSLDAALDFYPAQSRALLVASVERAAADGTPYDVEVDFVTAHGEQRRVRAMGELEEVDGEAVALIGAFQDITERYRAEEALRRSAAIDDLTGLANRAGFNAALDKRLAQANVASEPLALLLIDLDGFKAINDHCGHLAGDDVLQAVARQLARPSRAGCMAARLGGDEFVLLLDFPADSTAFHAAVESLLADLRLAVPCEGSQLFVSGTIGISWFDGASSRRDLLNRADQALYTAKRTRKGTARVFGSDLTFG